MRSISIKWFMLAAFIFVFQIICPASASSLTLKETLEFFGDTELMYSENTGKYHPGVDICILWEKAGIEPGPAYPGAQEYLFDHRLGRENITALHYPEIRIFERGDIRILRVGAPLRVDYQFLIFREEGEDHIFFDHIDLYSQKYHPPAVEFIADNLMYVDTLAMAGTGVSYTVRVFYLIDQDKAETALRVPLEGWIDGWGMMFSRRFKSEITFSGNILAIDYKTDISANTDYYESSFMDTPERFHLFSITGNIFFNWDGLEFELDQEISRFDVEYMDFLFYLGESHFYAEFKDRFDSLRTGDDKEKEWYGIFIRGLEGLSED